jgi:hypothetical protein
MRRLIRENRDTRVDFFRGYALFCIFISHIPDHRFWIFTIQILGPSDATETFIFLAGYAAAIAYGGQYLRNGWAYAATSLGLRAWNLYVVHIFMFVAFIAQVSWSAARFDNPAYLDETRVAEFLHEPYLAVLDALLLRFQPAFMDILPLYIVVLLWFALLLPLLDRPWAILGISGGMWLFVRITGFNLPTSSGTWFFNPLAWQFLFVIGAVVSHLGVEGRDRWLTGRWYLTAGAILVALGGLFISAVWRIPGVYEALPQRPADWIFFGIDKAGLHPARLLHFLAVAYLVSRLIPRGSRFPLMLPAQPFTLCGQHGLMVFAMGVFLSFVGRLVMQEVDASWWTQSALAVAGWTVCTAFAAAHAWYDSAARAPAARAGPPAAAALAHAGLPNTPRPVPPAALAKPRPADSNVA